MRIILSIVLALGFYTGLAQQDSVRAEDSVASSSVSDDHEPVIRHKVPFRDENEEKISSSEIPPVLRRTLEAAGEYRGWENASFYRNIQTSEFRMELVQGQKRMDYYFDKEGRSIRPE